jgi:hypothetical protein
MVDTLRVSDVSLVIKCRGCVLGVGDVSSIGKCRGCTLGIGDVSLLTSVEDACSELAM